MHREVELCISGSYVRPRHVKVCVFTDILSVASVLPRAALGGTIISDDYVAAHQGDDLLQAPLPRNAHAQVEPFIPRV